VSGLDAGGLVAEGVAWRRHQDHGPVAEYVVFATDLDDRLSGIEPWT
jgi:hypothetical protein